MSIYYQAEAGWLKANEPVAKLAGGVENGDPYVAAHKYGSSELEFPEFKNKFWKTGFRPKNLVESWRLSVKKINLFKVNVVVEILLKQPPKLSANKLFANNPTGTDVKFGHALNAVSNIAKTFVLNNPDGIVVNPALVHCVNKLSKFEAFVQFANNALVIFAVVKETHNLKHCWKFIAFTQAANMLLFGKLPVALRKHWEKFIAEAGNTGPFDILTLAPLKQFAKLWALVQFENIVEGGVVVPLIKQLWKLTAFVQFVKVPAFNVTVIEAKVLLKFIAEAGNNPEGVVIAPANWKQLSKFWAFVQLLNAVFNVPVKLAQLAKHCLKLIAEAGKNAAGMDVPVHPW